MPLSNSVLRRYTPPTCTLQIVARSSPVSRWVKRRSVPTLLQFELRFDDPRLPEEQQVNIHGDRNQLEALHEAVTTYVQDLLNQSPDRFNAVFSGQATPSPDAAVSSSPQALDLSSNDSQALSPEPRPLESSNASAHLYPSAVPKEAIATPTREIFFQPGRGLSHDLFLGPLATQETGPVIQLSVLQLFDLANALDEYAADVVVPSVSRPRLVPVPPAWASITALVLLAAGLMTAVVQVLNRSDSQQQIANRSAQGSSSNDQRQNALQPSVVPGVPTPPLSSPETLPSPPPVGNLVPSPSSSLPSGTVPGTTPALPNAPSANTPQTLPVIPATPRANAPQTPPVIPIPPGKPAPPIFTNPGSSPDWSLSIPGEATAPKTSGRRSPTPIPSPSAAIPSPSPQITPANPDLEAALSEANRAADPSESTDKPTAGSRDSATVRERLRGTPTQTRSSSTPTTPDKPKVTAFDTIPQVAQVREYFQQQWEPPSGLTQTLEYSLVLDVDGTIQQIEPLGQAARNYVDRTGMPLIGERFVSPNKNGQTPRIRVVLNPDGKVQTFLESSN